MATRTKSRAIPKRAAKRAAKPATRPARGRAPRRAPSVTSGTRPVEDLFREALAGLERRSSAHDRANLARFGITAKGAYGVSMANLKLLAKQLGKNHDLAAALWKTDRYEARMLATLVDDPALVTVAQMDGWCRGFDNWGICDTACFCLFDRSPHAWGRVKPWSGLRGEYGRRAAFALLASLALHDKSAPDAPFRDGLRLVEGAATDERNFVKKGVLWALRAIGMRNAALHADAVHVARRLSTSSDATARWVGSTALRELTAAKVARRFAPKRRG